MCERLKFYVGFLLLLIEFFNIHAQNASSIVEAIHSGEIQQLKKALEVAKIDSPLSDKESNALFLAITLQKSKLVDYLLKSHANPNTRFHGRTLLMYSVQLKKVDISRKLLKYGADVNALDSMGNSALMIAATNQKTGFARLLIHKGASLNIRNTKGYSARDFAVRSNNRVMTAYLSGVFEKHLPNYFDGPYIFYKGHKRIKIAYLKHDSIKHRTELLDSIYKFKGINQLYMGIYGDKNSYSIQRNFKRPNSTLTNRKKLLIIGDIHGQFDTLKLFLKKNLIVDKDLNWNFGTGTVVFMGDIFDRGEGVTEALWLIYKLENQARIVGGEVQLILGNHELMIFQEDLRYISEKYFYLFKDLKLNYSKFYSNKTLLGNWLKSKNTILKIDTLLFVHGGLNSNILYYKLPTDSINTLIYNYLNNIKKPGYKDSQALQFLLSYNGPFWYRGMVEKSDAPALSEDELNNLLKYYNVRHILIGHTFFPEVKLFNQGKVITTDVPFYLPDGSRMQAILIENEKSFLLNTSGNKNILKLYSEVNRIQ